MTESSLAREIQAPVRAWSTMVIKSLDEERREIEGMASTPSVDKLGDIVEPLGARYSLPLPLLHQHKHDQPVGQVVYAKASKDGIAIRAKLARISEPGPLKDRVDTAWGELRAGLVRGLSIGFSPNWEKTERLKDGGLRYEEYGLHEISLVTVAANTEASISLIRSLDQSGSGASATEPERSSAAPGVSGKPVVLNPKRKERSMSKTIAEQIAALEASRVAKTAQMSEVMQKSVDEGRSTDQAEQETFDELEREVDAINADLARFRKLEKQMAATAQPIPQQVKSLEDGSAARGPVPQIRVTPPQLEKGIRFARVAMALAQAQGNRAEAARIAEARHYDDQPTIDYLKGAVYAGGVSNEMIQKAAVNAATTGEQQWAGVLALAVTGEAGVVGDFLELLRPMTIVGQFGTNGIPALRRVPFRTGLLEQTSKANAWWVGEAAAKPVTRFDLRRQTLEPTKIANIAVLTDELVAQSTPSAEALVRDELARAIAEVIDQTFIDPAITASGARPASVTNAAVAIQSSGGTADQVRADVLALKSVYAQNNNRLNNGVWIMKSTTATALEMMHNPLGQPEFPTISARTGGTFAGLPVIVSDYVPASGSPTGDYVVLLDTQSVWFADDGGISVDMSREASLQMDDAPTMTGGGVGASPAAPTAVSVVSLWQANLVGIRCERTLNWKVARPHGVQVLWGVNWGGS